MSCYGIFHHGQEHDDFTLRLDTVFQVWRHVNEGSFRRLLLLTAQLEMGLSFRKIIVTGKGAVR